MEKKIEQEVEGEKEKKLLGLLFLHPRDKICCEIEVKNSPVHGLGVFSLEKIPPYSRIMVCSPVVLCFDLEISKQVLESLSSLAALAVPQAKVQKVLDRLHPRKDNWEKLEEKRKKGTQKDKEKENEENFRDLTEKIACNKHEKLVDGISCLYNYPSIMNHNCRSNCTIVIDDKTKMVMVISIRLINIGDEMTINYGDHRNIKESHGIICDPSCRGPQIDMKANKMCNNNPSCSKRMIDNLKFRCRRCFAQAYCSEKCMKDHFNVTHKAVCCYLKIMCNEMEQNQGPAMTEALKKMRELEKEKD